MSAIRPATVFDLEPLSQLLDDYRRFYAQPGDQPAARAFLAQRLASADSRLLVHAERSGALSGFVQLFPLLSTVGLAPRWLLNDLYVNPEARGRGIGRALMTAAATLAREHGVPSLTLSTQTHNKTAQRLYESLGWQRNDAFHGYTLTLA